MVYLYNPPQARNRFLIVSTDHPRIHYAILPAGCLTVTREQPTSAFFALLSVSGLLQDSFKPFIYFVPVNDVPERFDEFGPQVLVIEVISMLPDVEI